MEEIKLRFVKEDGSFANDIALIKGKPFREVNPTDNRFVRVYDQDGYGIDYYNNWATYKLAKDIIGIDRFTGKKDVYGVDIYESDIVKLNYDDCLRVVEYVESEGCFKLRHLKEYCEGYYMNDGNIEVVGNLWQDRV